MATKQQAINAIQDYPHISRLIRERELELEYPFDAYPDQNIDGGRAQNVRDESIEAALERKLADPQLAYYKQEEKAVERALRKCVKKGVRSLLDDATYDIIYETYLREDQLYNVDQIAQMANVSRRSVFRRKNAFIEEVRSNLEKVAL